MIYVTASGLSADEQIAMKTDFRAYYQYFAPRALTRGEAKSWLRRTMLRKSNGFAGDARDQVATDRDSGAARYNSPQAPEAAKTRPRICHIRMRQLTIK